MTFLRRFLWMTTLVVLFSNAALATDTFIVRHLKFEGLQRISLKTAEHYLPIHVGQRFTEQKSEEIIQSLYETGFFSDVQLFKRMNTLIIQVKERPIISEVQITGNKAITRAQLKPVLQSLNIEVGEVYDSSQVNQVVQGLQQEYSKLGYHATKVSTKVTPLSRNRVLLNIRVNEGPIAKVHSINFIGNKAFSSKTLRNQFKLTTPGITTWISHNDRYSKAKLNEDLQRLSDFYLNEGYIRFRVLSDNATLTQDKKGVDIVVRVDEGALYRVNDYRVEGDTLGESKALSDLITVKKGDAFSRKATINTQKALSDHLANEGYAFPKIAVLPQINDQAHLVNIAFRVTSGQCDYVRRINFFGNQRTTQEVMRREVRQMEGGAYSLSQVNESKRRIANLPYLKDVTVTKKPVPGNVDQVDLDYKVKEVAAGKATVQAGYSDVYGFLYGANISEPNFMGSGETVSIGFENSEVENYYNFRYTNPYYTVDGISRSVNLYYQHMKPNSDYNYASYTMDGYGVDIAYGIPVSEHNSFTIGYGYENVLISNLDPSIAAPSVLDFIGCDTPYDECTLTGARYDIFKATTGWKYSTLDRYIFPTTGLREGVGLELGVPVLDSSPGYYKLTYTAKWYHPISHGFVFTAHTTLGYGDGYGDIDVLPFFENFYGGGIGTLPAYAPNSLGPKNTYNSDGALGGSLETFAGFDIILPQFINDRVRTAISFDVGNVFQSPLFADDDEPQIEQNDSFAWKNLRTSVGFLLTWYSPLGPLNLSLAFPLDKKDGDNLEAFQFSFGTTI